MIDSAVRCIVPSQYNLCEKFVKISLGTWRFFLAFLVAISHLWAGMIDGPAAYAVWGFFVLSGYLMTLVLMTKYTTPSGGLRQFALNRLLRIYPSFLAASALGIVTIVGLGRLGIDPAGLNPQFMLPQGPREWLSNLGMVPFVTQRGLPVPVAAALFVEVWAYALMPLFARSRSAAVLGLAVAFLANLQFGFGMPTFVARYCGFATGLMPFAVGAVVCHYRERLRQFAHPTLSVAVWCAHGLIWLADPYWPWTYGLWLSVPLSAWVVLSLVAAKAGAADKFAGELSYPLYLLHTTVAAWFLPLFGFGRSLWFFALSFTATLMVSWAMLRLIDTPVQRLKRQSATLPRAAPGKTLSLSSRVRV
jgi:peptidoglycan/LPS O-acetylase OafA/YrhL